MNGSPIVRPGQPSPGTARIARDTAQTSPKRTARMISWTQRACHRGRGPAGDWIEVGPADAPLPCRPGILRSGQARSRNGDVGGDVVVNHSSASGGARGGCAAGTSVGRPRWPRMRRITRASSISAISRRRPPRRGHARTSNPKLRCMSCAQSRCVCGRGEDRQTEAGSGPVSGTTAASPEWSTAGGARRRDR